MPYRIFIIRFNALDQAVIHIIKNISEIKSYSDILLNAKDKVPIYVKKGA